MTRFSGINTDNLKVVIKNLISGTAAATAAAKSLQLCPTLCDPRDGSPPGSPGPGILQARTLEWVAISFSNAWKWKVKVNSLSNARPSETPWTEAHQAPLSMGFSRQEYWSGVPLPSPISYITTLYLSKWRNWHWHIITTSLTLDFICFSPLFPMNVLFLFQNSFQGTHCN